MQRRRVDHTKRCDTSTSFGVLRQKMPQPPRHGIVNGKLAGVTVKRNVGRRVATVLAGLRGAGEPGFDDCNAAR